MCENIGVPKYLISDKKTDIGIFDSSPGSFALMSSVSFSSIIAEKIDNQFSSIATKFLKCIAVDVIH